MNMIRLRYINGMAWIALLGVAMLFSGCVEDYSILVSTQDVRFGLASETQTLVITANCKWTITKNDNADWYTITPMSGRANDSIVTITVNAYPDGDFRESTFFVSSPGGHVRRTIFVTQNKLAFDVTNKVFGLTTLEHWNTDYFGQIVEDSYERLNYNPYDTTQGQQMFFFEDGHGIQRRVKADGVLYYSFDYAYDADSSIFHIQFHLVDGGIEPYNAQVLCASDSLYRVFHEYKPNWWERADMRKIGTIPAEKATLMRKVTSREGMEGIFKTERSN